MYGNAEIWVGSEIRRRIIQGTSPVGEPVDPVIIHFPKLSHTPPVRNPSGLSRRERILALYRQQGRPQAHLDRVMKLGMGSLEEVRKKWEDRFREGSMRSNIKRYGSNGPPPPCRPPPPANPPRKPA